MDFKRTEGCKARMESHGEMNQVGWGTFMRRRATIAWKLTPLKEGYLPLSKDHSLLFLKKKKKKGIGHLEPAIVH